MLCLSLYCPGEASAPGILGGAVYSGAPVPGQSGDFSCGVLNICSHLQLATAHTSAAIYRSNGNHATLFTMVSNHRAASHLLVTLGFAPPCADPDATSSARCVGGCQITAAEIVAALGWAPHTWKKKSQAYAWAEEAAEMIWTGIHPRKLFLSAFVFVSGFQLTSHF